LRPSIQFSFQRHKFYRRQVMFLLAREGIILLPFYITPLLIIYWYPYISNHFLFSIVSLRDAHVYSCSYWISSDTRIGIKLNIFICSYSIFIMGSLCIICNCCYDCPIIRQCAQPLCNYGIHSFKKLFCHFYIC